MNKRKLTPEEKIKRKLYLKMLKKHKKIIMKAAKQAADDPFDYGIGLDLFVKHLRFMQEYYKIGYNVWAMEIEDLRPRYDGITAALEAYDIWQDEDNKLFDSIYNFDDSAPKELYGKPRNNLSGSQAAELYRNKVETAKHEFFEILENEMESWWD